MGDRSYPKGPWVKDPSTAVVLINDIQWRATEGDMILLRELSLVADGERERVRFEVGDRDV